MENALELLQGTAVDDRWQQELELEQVLIQATKAATLEKFESQCAR